MPQAHSGDGGGPTGLLVVDKPAGITSHGVVARARRVFRTRKIGHAGTLDPMATGVLILGVGRATRLLGHLALHDKAYTATIQLGATTVTDDAEGEVVTTSDASAITLDAVEEAMRAYVGDIDQVPSAVSAIKVDGVRSYARVRDGQEVELPARRVNVSRFELLEARPVGEFLDCDVEVECSSGTYVRALARDLGADLGVGGHLTALRRTRIGGYRIEDAVQLGDPAAGEVVAPPLMSMADAARLSFPVVSLDEGQAADVRFGRPLPIEAPADVFGVLGPDGDLLALYRPIEGAGRSRPLAVLA